MNIQSAALALAALLTASCSGDSGCGGLATIDVTNNGNVSEAVYVDGSHQGNMAPGGRLTLKFSPGAHSFYTVETSGPLVGEQACQDSTIELVECQTYAVDCGVNVQ